ncbi:hypothetical protein NAEGRDRAFT_82145 [Naegleria gruberi]|uniref:Uncharacterized protein n=1 Tax=Naegleria gruberi TaxID=5762 RepID=D2W2I9_NAEGR|nr:uncharacterized protein NAEGRDRAFT_82145 [Naegleria gruberi]EFC36721.1 hypothetical protein NAEGRDRAFT_82145 [Naegleria gruberi]|eukprot:XP_002669465.1 hypothetical protein NAEGRDRAFT_82145 [Naegleria gruberi strain NEG-M]
MSESNLDRLITLSDLRNNFSAIKSLTNTTFAKEYKNDELFYQNLLETQQKEILPILQQYSMSNLYSECIHRTLEIGDNDGEKEICMKTILLIYVYMLEISKSGYTWNIPEFRLFIYYVEEKALKQFFDCCKRIYQSKQEAELETGVESLENWQYFILHIYIRIHNDIITIDNGIEGFTECPPFCVLLTLSKYFCEKRDKFVNENPGKFWKKSKIESFVLHNHLLFWNRLIEVIYEIDISSHSSDAVYRAKLKTTVFAKVVMDCFYNIADLNSTKKEGNSFRVVLLIIAKLSHVSPLHYDLLMKLMAHDYEQIKNTPDSTVLSANDISKSGEIANSKYCGKYAWIIKHKILSIISSLLNDVAGLGTNMQFVSDYFYYFNFITEMLKNESEIESGSLLGQQAIITAIETISLNANLNREECTVLSEHESNVLNYCKKLIFSKNRRLRRLTNTYLGKFFDKTEYCSDDLLKSIIQSHELVTDDVTDFCEMLQGVAKCFGNDHSIVGESVLESFGSLIYKIFEIVCVDDKKKYLQDSKDKGEEGMMKIHKRNVEKVFELLEETYSLIQKHIQLEVLLTYMKKTTEELVDNVGALDTSILPLFSLVLNEICVSTKTDDLVESFEKLGYYQFLIEFIEFFINEGEHFSLIEVGPIFILIACLSDIQLLHTKFTIDMVSEHKMHGKQSIRNFVYDYLIPIIIKSSNLPIDIHEYIGGERYFCYLDKISESYYAWNRIMLNDIAYTGRCQILPSIIDSSTKRIREDLQTLLGLEKPLTEEDALDEAISNAVITLILLNRHQIEKVAEIVMQFMPVIYKDSFYEIMVHRYGRVNILITLMEIVEYSMYIGIFKFNYLTEEWIIGLLEQPMNNIYLRALIQRVFAHIEISNAY